MHKVFTIILFLLISTSNFANVIDEKKATVNITGHVCDANTKEPLEGTKVFIKELDLTLYTDVNGNFNFDGFQGDVYNYKLELISYEKVEVCPKAKSKEFIIELEEVD